MHTPSANLAGLQSPPSTSRNAGGPTTGRYLADRKVQLAFAAAVLILLIVGAFSYRGIVASSSSDERVRHTYEVLDNLQELQISMERMESANRGYLLTGDENYLTSYSKAIRRADQHQNALRQLTAENPGQQRRLSTLDTLVAQKTLFLDHVLRLRQQRDLAAAAAEVSTGRGQLIMAKFHTAAREFQGAEQGLLMARTSEAEWRVGQPSWRCRICASAHLFSVMSSCASLQPPSGSS